MGNDASSGPSELSIITGQELYDSELAFANMSHLLALQDIGLNQIANQKEIKESILAMENEAALEAQMAIAEVNRILNAAEFEAEAAELKAEYATVIIEMQSDNQTTMAKLEGLEMILGMNGDRFSQTAAALECYAAAARELGITTKVDLATLDEQQRRDLRDAAVKSYEDILRQVSRGIEMNFEVSRALQFRNAADTLALKDLQDAAGEQLLSAAMGAGDSGWAEQQAIMMFAAAEQRRNVKHKEDPFNNGSDIYNKASNIATALLDASKMHAKRLEAAASASNIEQLENQISEMQVDWTELEASRVSRMEHLGDKAKAMEIAASRLNSITMRRRADPDRYSSLSIYTLLRGYRHDLLQVLRDEVSSDTGAG